MSKQISPINPSTDGARNDIQNIMINMTAKLIYLLKTLPRNSYEGRKYNTLIKKIKTKNINPSDIIDFTENTISDLLVRYYKMLPDYGINVKNKKELFNQNMVDIRKAFPRRGKGTMELIPIEINDNDTEFCDKNGFFSIIPCFKNGVLIVNHKRFIEWELLDINVDENTIKLKLTDYTENDNSNIELGTSGTCSIPFYIKDGSFYFDTNVIDVITYYDIYTKVPKEKRGFDKVEQFLWQQCVVENAKVTLNRFGENGGDYALGSLMKFFITANVKINNMLSKNKPTKAKKQQTANTRNNRTIENTPQSPPELKIRNVGVITMKSEKPPRMASYDTIVHYKIAQWKTRGHIRHYKNGKTVYVKESVHKRKALQGKTDDNISNIRINIIDKNIDNKT